MITNMPRREMPSPGELGLPEHSTLTIEGRIERAGSVGNHLLRSRDGREQRVWHSDWAIGLWLIVGVFGLLIAALVVLYVVG
jgi:hypothetical protein